MLWQDFLWVQTFSVRGGEQLPYKKGGVTHQKTSTEPLKDTRLVIALAEFWHYFKAVNTLFDNYIILKTDEDYTIM